MYSLALSGMSTIAQLAQLRCLAAVKPTCSLVILAIGTNDAAHRITEEQFEHNLRQIVTVLQHNMDVQPIVFLPAVYSTIAAHDPSIAGTLERVEGFNAHIEQLGRTESLPVPKEIIQPLFERAGLTRQSCC